ncbi:hypothetical protein NE237_021323 [Protea cynaroides]|uniref:Uncharacterized protein n=1 Tax=Protea cynaroides TaxID=273540 RepID=A0A9Q0K4S3_9MAGN|nr:hypothetical protein NE237_021323 [Protea cynaroides]
MEEEKKKGRRSREEEGKTETGRREEGEGKKIAHQSAVSTIPSKAHQSRNRMRREEGEKEEEGKKEGGRRRWEGDKKETGGRRREEREWKNRGRRRGEEGEGKKRLTRKYSFDLGQMYLVFSQGTNVVQGFQVDFRNVSEEERKELDNLTTEALLKMPNLRLLHIEGNEYEWTPNWKHSHDDGNLYFKNLVWLRWRIFPFSYIPSNFHMRNLVILTMQWSKLKEVWKETKSLPNLKVLDLCNSHYLTCTPDFSGVPNLETLNLGGCTKLVEVHESIGHLSKLVELNLRRCSSLKNLPSGICKLASLKKLNIDGCSSIEKLPEKIGSLTCLTSFKAESIKRTKELPSTLGNLCCLKSLHLCENGFFRLPRSICELSQLETLDLYHCESLKSLPMLPSSLCFLNVSHCKSLEKLSTLSNLKHLRKLCLSNCSKLNEIEGVEGLESAEFINFGNCNNLEKRIIQDIISYLPNRDTCQFVFDGEEIPKWFEFRNEEFSINSEMQGLIICFVLDLNYNRWIRLWPLYSPCGVAVALHNVSKNITWDCRIFIDSWHKGKRIRVIKVPHRVCKSIADCGDIISVSIKKNIGGDIYVFDENIWVHLLYTKHDKVFDQGNFKATPSI